VVADEARVQIGDQVFLAAPERPFVFGRAPDEERSIVGLNREDMGVSSEAGSIELQSGVWWVINRSAKRRLLIEPAPGADPITVERGHPAAIVTSSVRLLVPGALYTYVLDVTVPEDYAASLQRHNPGATGTIVPGAEVDLSTEDRRALAAMFSGYLEPWPHHRELANGYAKAAHLAGPSWTETAIRRRIETIRERFREAGYYFEGDRAREDLATHLVGNAILTEADLDLLDGRTSERQR
jgi:hypothetical protein